jgi:drug/metabolite transporter (DMT)-like permease
MDIIIKAILPALFFALWATLGQKSKFSGYVIGCSVSFISFITQLTLVSKINKQNVFFSLSKENIWQILLLLFMGILNGVGTYFYTKDLNVLPATNTSYYIMSVSSLMQVCAFILGIFILQKPFEYQKLLGLTVILIGIFLLNKN